MTRKEALEALLVKVKAGSAMPHQVFNAFDTPCHDMALQQRAEDAVMAYNGSLDAAKALHEAVIGPDWSVSIELGAVYWDVTLTHYPWREHDRNANWVFEGALQDNPSRAWLIAIIKALIAECAAAP